MTSNNRVAPGPQNNVKKIVPGTSLPKDKINRIILDQVQTAVDNAIINNTSDSEGFKIVPNQKSERRLSRNKDPYQ